MALSTKLNLTNAKVEQLSGGTLHLSGDTVIYPNTGELKYAVHPSSFTSITMVDAAYVTGQTSGLIADIDYISGVTAANTADIANLAVWSGQTNADIDYISGVTAANTADIANLAVWSGTTTSNIAANTADIANLAVWSGTTTSNIAANTADIANLAVWSGLTDGRLDVIEGQYITGGTSGLLPDGAHDLKLGGAITENTTLFGSFGFGVNANTINLTGGTGGANGVYLNGDLYALDLVGEDDLVCVNSTTGRLGTTSLSAFGGITGGTNGVSNFSNQRLGLGGALVQDTSICGAGFDLNLGTAVSKLDVFDIQAAGTSNITTGGLTVCSSGGTITDLRAVKAGICYAGDYSSSFVGNSLVTKCYVDTVAAGLQPHDVVRVATTADIDLTGAETIDGIVLSTGDRVLVKNQNTGSQNGIYVVNTAGAWTRAEDFDFSPAGEIVNGDLVPVFTGSTQANTLWVVTSTDPIASGDSINFTIFSRLLGVVAGDGIDVTPVGANQTISVDLMTSGGLAICSTELAVAETIAGNGLSWSAGVVNANAVSGGVAGISVRYDGSDNLVVNAADINTALGGVLTGSTNGLTDANGVVSLGGALAQATTITGNDTCTLTYTDAAVTNKRGIVYGGDYCATFTDRSLVDKAYVVRYTTGLTSNLQADIDYISGVTSANVADINNLAVWSASTNADITYISGVTSANTADINNLAVWSASTNADITYISGVTSANTADIAALGAISGITNVSITGATNGLTKSGTNVSLGGTLTGNTAIYTNDNQLIIYDTNSFGIDVGVGEVIIGNGNTAGDEYVWVTTTGTEIFASGATTCAQFNVVCYGRAEMCAKSSSNVFGQVSANMDGIGTDSVYLRMVSGSTTLSAVILTGTTVNLCGTTYLKTQPGTGSTVNDYVLVRDASTGAIQQIPASSLGQDNNDYEKAIVTTSTGLTTTSPYVILVNHTAPVTITLPATPFDGQAFKIKDAANNALTYNITIARNGNNIDRQASNATINTDSGALELVYDAGLGWFTLAFVN